MPARDRGSAGPGPRPRLVIVGGGPAGAATARALRRLAPHLADRTVLLERAPARRDKLCGGGLTGGCVRELEALGLQVRVPAVRINRGVFRYRDVEREFPIQSPSYVVRRDHFDDDLLSQVEDDVEVRRGEAVVALHRTDTSLYVESDRQLYRARLVIGADGVGSRVRRFLFGELGIDIEPVTRLFQSDIARPFRPGEADAMTFDFSVLDRGVHGYFWTFPSLRGEESIMNTGVMHLAPHGGVDAKAVLREWLDRYAYPGADAARVRGHPELAYDPGRPIGGRGVMLVGDAAGIEPLTGEGIAQCIAYGRYAARLARRQHERGSRDFSGFRRLVARSPLGREMTVARLLARRLYGRAWRFWIDLFLRRPALGQLLALQTEGRDHLYRHLPRLLSWYAGHRLRWWADAHSRTMRSSKDPDTASASLPTKMA